MSCHSPVKGPEKCDRFSSVMLAAIRDYYLDSFLILKKCRLNFIRAVLDLPKQNQR